MSWLLKAVTGNPMILIWIALGAFAAGAGSGGLAAWKFQGMRLDVAEATVESQKVKIQALGDQITSQNAAIKVWEDAAKAAKAKGAKATAAAQKKAKIAQSEVNRLSGLLKGHENKAKTCKDALADVRKGMQP